MKVLLINPAYRGDDPYTAVGFRLPPLGLLYIGASLREVGHDVTVHDEIVRPEDKIPFHAHDLVGIGGDTPRHNRVVEIAQKAKAAGKRVVLGGCHVTFEDEAVLSQGVGDMVVRGEGEETIVDLVEVLSKRDCEKNLPSVSGITWVDGEGKIHRNPDRPFSPNLDGIPRAARDMINMDDYRFTRIQDRPITGIFTSRGCPHNCNFCTTPSLYGRKWRGHDPKKVGDELEEIVHVYGFKGIAFLDDNFILDVDRTLAICDEIVERKLDILWWCACRADTIVGNEDLVRKMKEAGCWYCFIGLESSQPHILKEMQKQSKPDHGRLAVEILRRHGIRTMASFVIGHMNETREDIMATLRYAIRVNPASAQFCVVTPYPGTQIRRKHRDRIVSSNWDHYNSVCALMRTHTLEPHDIQRLLRWMYLRFYIRPPRIVRALGGSLGRHAMGLSKTLALIRTIPRNGVVNTGLPGVKGPTVDR
jgi:anaerobic magnesium-protoporphyrin IX monomethyl ester cyclase